MELFSLVKWEHELCYDHNILTGINKLILPPKNVYRSDVISFLISFEYRKY